MSIDGYTSFPGIRWRLKDPTTELVLRVEGSLESHTLERYRHWFEQRFARCFRFAEERFPCDWLANPEADALAVHLAAGITALQRLGCQPVRRTQVLAAEGGLLLLALPSFNGTVLQGAIRLGIQLLLELDAAPSDTSERLHQLGQEIELFLEQAPQVSRCGEEMMRFALAADSLGIPLVSTATRFLEIGHGSARRILSNSLLTTPTPAAALASDKLATYLVLHRAGIPVPATRIVNTEADLSAAAQELRWPLVVKPLDQSLKRGVTIGVADQITLEAAFRVARNVSAESVLVQEQVEGEEFRLTAIGGDFQAARQINPAVVEGNGRHTVRQLVEACNADPRRGDHAGALSARIQLDAEVEALLTEQQLGLEVVAAVGQPVRISRMCGRLAGGITSDAKGLLHPSYFVLLQRVRQVLQLDVLGLDLITPDPARPWWEVDARVLEVNPRPGLSLHEHADPSLRIYEEALRFGLRGSAQPALVAVAGFETLQALWQQLEQALSAALPAGTALGVLREGACHLEGQPLALDPAQRQHLGQALLADPRCGAALLAWQAADLADYGRPCERVDLAVLAAGAAPQALQEILDAYPAAVIWIGPGRKEWEAALQLWQAHDPAHRLVVLEGGEGLSARLPELLGASTYPSAATRAVRLPPA